MTTPRPYQTVLASILLALLALRAPATVLLDDTFPTGTRNTQNLPTNSAWFASNAGALTAAPGAMTLTLGSSAVLAVTYFTPNATSPVSLNVGDSIVATITYTLNGVAPENTSQGFRLALCRFGTTRASADFSSSSSQGANVNGYALFQNMGVNFGSASPIDIRVRTNLTSSSLLGTGSDWGSLGTGPSNTNTFSGFTSGTQYTLQFLLQRTDT